MYLVELPPRRCTRIARVLMGVLGMLGAFAAHGGYNDWEFQFLKTPQGEWANEISDVLVDREGTLWAASWGEGLHRIKGTEWDNFREDGGFVGDWQRCLAEDTSGGIWVGTADGLCRFIGDSQTTFTTENTPSLLDHNVRRMLVTKSGDLIIGTGDGYVYRCSRDALTQAHPQEWVAILGPEETEGHVVSALMEAEDGHLVVGLKFHGVLEFDGEAWRRVTEIPLNWTAIFGAVYKDDSGQETIFAAHNYGSSPLYRRRNGIWTVTDEVGAAVYCLKVGHDRALYAGTDNGLYRYSGTAWSPVDIGQDLGNPNIRAMDFSTPGVMWLGTYEGLSRGTKRSWTREDNAVFGAPTRGIIAAGGPNDEALALTVDNRTFRFEGDSWVFATKLEGLKGLNVVDWTAIHEGAFWILDGNRMCYKIAVADGERLQRVSRPPSFAGRVEPRMNLYLGTGGELYLYSDEAPFRLVDGEWVSLIEEDEAAAWSGGDAMAQIADGPLYFGGREGFASWTENGFIDLKDTVGIDPKDSCHAIAVLATGAVWFGTHGSGIYVVDGTSFYEMNRKDGLRSDSISALMASADGSVWAAYRRQGLGCYRDGYWINFDVNHGLPNTPVTRMVEFPNGVIYAQMEDGSLYRYRPDTSPPDTQIVASAGLVDAHGIASFSYEGWDAWDHTSRRKLRYTTRVLPLNAGEADIPWSELLENTTHVTSPLTAGDYVFEVRASDEDGNLDLTPARVAFNVLLPFWKRPPFYVPMVLFGALCLISLVFWYKYFLRVQQSEWALSKTNLTLKKQIEERDFAEAALKQSEAHLARAQAFAKLGSWDLSASTQVGIWSKEMFSLFNRDPALGTPKFQEFIKRVHPEDRRTFIKKHRELFETGEPFEVVFRTNPKHGPMKYVRNTVHGHLDDKGDIIRFSGTTQDITAQKQAELDRIDLEEKLRQSQKLEAVGQLVGGIAHDFNNILHALLGFCQLARDADGRDPGLVDECLVGIDAAGKRAADLVHQLLTFSRREKMDRKVFRLEPVINETLTLLRRTLPTTIDLIWAPEQPCHPVYADPTQLQQIILNLCTNAWQAMEANGGTLQLKLTDIALNEPLVINTGRIGPGNFVRFSVQDTGPGINADVIQNIFDPFFTTKGVGSGTGLGLATVHGIAQSLGGGVAVDSSLGGGATFHVYLKQAEESEIPAELVVPTSETSAVKPGRILLVDDEQSIVQLTQRTLKGMGYEVDAYEDAILALDAFNREPDAFSVVITDFTMPKMTGVGLAEAIRRKNAVVPILMLSGHFQDAMVVTSHITEVLRKPITMRKLINAIERNTPANS